MNRTQLKQQLLDERDGTCDFCGLALGLQVDMHEWLIKRSGIGKSNKTKIFDPRNCSLLHTSCHAEWGQTKRLKERLAPLFVERYGKPAMFEFITSLNLKASHEYTNLIKKCYAFYW